MPALPFNEPGDLPILLPDAPTPPNSPSPPHVQAPPTSPSGQQYNYPFLPSCEPCGADRPSVSVDIQPDRYLVICSMPHFHHSSIMITTRRGHSLRIAADRWDTAPTTLLDGNIIAPSPAHFERWITFEQDADMARIRAGFDQRTLNVCIPRQQRSSTARLPPLATHRARMSSGC
ncbi:hypothetical protein FRC08_004200 [Ceratobasidium sp. 394]|nr:hypothetical protein FRC08_004200 [Ceratobasidium sp. 394]KAG9082116.1 hypothetical protein FS749_007102 [Ceratobasidium sp. UAMH 11750]